MEVGIKYKILSIDEEKEVQYFLKRMFLKEGYKLFTAQSGRDGIAQLTNSCPDLVLLDVVLPDADGIEMVRKVRDFTDCPLIVVSSRGKEKDKVTALDAGADDYVTKPFGSEELMARTLAPSCSRILRHSVTSEIWGIFSIRQTPSTRRAAGIIATAAFFAPLISTSPNRGVPP